ncbi:MAG: two-component regulator propeller domain-containing protein, partial [Bacteroidota bacterium]
VDNGFLANFQNWTQLSNLPFSQANYTDMTFFGPDQLLVLEPNETESSIWRLDIEQDTWDYLPGFESGLYYSIDANDEQMIVTTFQLTERFDMNLESLGAKFSVQGIVTDPRDATIGANNDIWIASRRGGLLAWLGQGDEVAIGIPGPDSNNARRIDAYNDNIWVAGGGVDVIWANRFEKDGFFGLVNDQWNIIPPPEGENGLGSVNDVMDAAVDPTNNNRVFFGSWEEGLIEVRNGQFQTIYNQDNSELKVRTGTEDFVGVAGVDFDVDGNLWITNTFSTNPLVLLTAGGNFVPMTFGNVIDEETLVGDIMVASNNYIWMILPRGNGLVVRDVGETIADPSDDNFRKLINEEGQGGLPTNEVFCVEEDIDGEVWVGTDQGIAVYYAPQSIFNSENFDAQQILITQDGNVQILLETEEVTCIEIDGANRKWVGTRGSGVFLFSPDGLEQIAHFTESNSPLLSNNVADIALNQRNGEVFFATELGISSYQGTATNFDQEINEITVFPNPVDPGFDGVITIDGLAYQSDVKIADLAGNAVFSGTSLGGRVVWDGTNFNGDKVSTGVYLVFASRDDGSATNVAKIAIVR